MHGLYESDNEVWEWILERSEYITEIVNPTIPEVIPVQIVVNGTTFGTNYANNLWRGKSNE